MIGDAVLETVLYGERLGIILMATSEGLARNPVKEEEMRHSKLFGAVILVVLAASMVLAIGCSSNSSSSSGSTTATVLKPEPQVESVVASTSGTQNAYYATVDIQVKNNGAAGVILVQASVTQSGKTSQGNTSVFLTKGQEGEAQLTFPLVWEGGNFSCTAVAIVP